MARLNELEIAQLSDEQIKKLQETERMINTAGNLDIYLLALKKSNSAKVQPCNRAETFITAMRPWEGAFLMTAAAGTAAAAAAAAAGRSTRFAFANI